MDALSITKAITRSLLISLVLAVFGFSLLLAPEITVSILVFSSIKALLTLPDVPREADPQALALFLSFQYVPHPWTGF